MDLVVRWKHDISGTEHVCTGEIFLRSEDESTPVEKLTAVDKVSFEHLMQETSKYLQKNDVNRLVMERNDKPGLRPIVMDNPTVELLRKDPKQAIILLSPPPIRVEVPRPSQPPILLAGYDTMAEALGDDVYCRMRGTLLECPGCALWTAVTSSARFQCKKRCQLSVSARFLEQWAKVSVQELLDSGLQRFYFPRTWNSSSTHPWVSKIDLQKLYTEFRSVRSES